MSTTSQPRLPRQVRIARDTKAALGLIRGPRMPDAANPCVPVQACFQRLTRTLPCVLAGLHLFPPEFLAPFDWPIFPHFCN